MTTEKLEIAHFITWQEMVTELKELKAKEMKARLMLCGFILGGEVGEFKDVTLLDGYKITTNSKVSRKLDEGVLSALMSDMTDTDKNAVRFKPSLDLRAYRKLPDDSLLHEAVTVSPATPTLKLEKL